MESGFVFARIEWVAASWHEDALPWCLAVARAPISSAYLCPWVLSLQAPPAKLPHWCALNKTLRCRSARDSQKIYVTFMTFTLRKGYRAREFSGSRGSSAHLCNDMGWIPVIGKLYKNLSAPLPLSVKLWQKRQLCCSLFSLEICHRWLSSCTQPRK